MPETVIFSSPIGNIDATRDSINLVWSSCHLPNIASLSDLRLTINRTGYCKAYYDINRFSNTRIRIDFNLPDIILLDGNFTGIFSFPYTDHIGPGYTPGNKVDFSSSEIPRAFSSITRVEWSVYGELFSL